MNFLIIALAFTLSSSLIAGPGGTGGGGVREMAHYQYPKGFTDHSISNEEDLAIFIHKKADGSYHFALHELQKYLPIAKIETTNGEVIIKEMMPSHYPIIKIQSIEMENGEVLFADDILEILTNDHQNLISI